MYGVLGLPAFRFYDLDNATAVTTTGQTVIKNTASMVNLKYNKELYSDERIEIIDEDGNTKQFRIKENVTVNRNGKEQTIFASDLVEGDEILSV